MGKIVRCVRCGLKHDKGEVDYKCKEAGLEPYTIEDWVHGETLQLCEYCRCDLELFLRGHQVSHILQILKFDADGHVIRDRGRLSVDNKTADTETPKKPTLLDKIFHVKK